MRLVSAASMMFVVTLILALSDMRSTTAAQTLDGQAIFRFDTFGDEQLWTDTLRLHEAVETITPAAALAVGLKVDVDALPPPVIRALTSGQLDVTDPKVTRRLLELNAVVGVIGKIAGDRIKSVGVTCALCHSWLLPKRCAKAVRAHVFTHKESGEQSS